VAVVPWKGVYISSTAKKPIGAYTKMTSRICKFGCQTLLEGFDEQARKYIEAGTGGLHTKERCEEAKLKLAQKNDHGNESFGPTAIYKEAKELQAGRIEAPPYVDHTAGTKGQSKVKIFLSTIGVNLENAYNDFLRDKNGKIRTQGAQFQMSGDGFAIALYYEELK